MAKISYKLRILRVAKLVKVDISTMISDDLRRLRLAELAFEYGEVKSVYHVDLIKDEAFTLAYSGFEFLRWSDLVLLIEENSDLKESQALYFLEFGILNN